MRVFGLYTLKVPILADCTVGAWGVSEKKGSGVPPENGLGGAKKSYRIPARISGSGVTLAAQANSSFSLPVLALAHRLMNEVDAVQIVSDTLPASVS